MLGYFLYNIGLTLAVELPIAALWGLRRRALLLVVLVNFLTNPAVSLLYLLAPELILLWECAAVGVEWYCYHRASVHAPLCLSALANISSFGLGFLLI